MHTVHTESVGLLLGAGVTGLMDGELEGLRVGFFDG